MVTDAHLVHQQNNYTTQSKTSKTSIIWKRNKTKL